MCAWLFLFQALRISNRPAFFNPRTPDRKGDIYADEYREQDEENAGESEGDVVGRYHQLYEQRMNPFDQVRRYFVLKPNCYVNVFISYPYSVHGFFF